MAVTIIARKPSEDDSNTTYRRGWALKGKSGNLKCFCAGYNDQEYNCRKISEDNIDKDSKMFCFSISITKKDPYNKLVREKFPDLHSDRNGTILIRGHHFKTEELMDNNKGPAFQKLQRVLPISLEEAILQKMNVETETKSPIQTNRYVRKGEAKRVASTLRKGKDRQRRRVLGTIQDVNSAYIARFEPEQSSPMRGRKLWPSMQCANENANDQHSAINGSYSKNDEASVLISERRNISTREQVDGEEHQGQMRATDAVSDRGDSDVSSSGDSIFGASTGGDEDFGSDSEDSDNESLSDNSYFDGIDFRDVPGGKYQETDADDATFLCHECTLESQTNTENHNKCIPFRRVNGATIKGYVAMDQNSIRTGKTRNIEWTLCGRKFRLPSNYRPVLEKEYKKLADGKTLEESNVIRTYQDEIATLDASKRLLETRLSQCETLLRAKQLENTTLKLELDLSRREADSNHQVAQLIQKSLHKTISENLKATDVGKRILEGLDKSQCPSTRLGQHLYCYGLSLAPKISVDAFTQAAPLIVSAWLADVGVLEKLDDPTAVAHIIPSPTTMHKFLKSEREHIYMQIASLINRGIPISKQHDKGHRANLDRCVVEVSYWDDDNDCVDQLRSGADGAGSSDKEVAEYLDTIFSKVDDYLTDERKEELPNGKCDTNGSTTDQGGGGVGDSVEEEWNKLLRKAIISYTSGCMMHGHNRPFQVAFEEALGKGGLGQDNILQFMHTCYSVQSAFGEHFKAAWSMFLHLADPSLAEDELDDVERIIKPILTRWGYVLQAAEGILDNWDTWVTFLSKTFELIDTKEKAMSQQCVELMKNPKTKCELEFIVAFGKVYWSKHFAWLHRVDKQTKRSGFSSHEGMPRIAAMRNEFLSIRNNWETMPEFAQFRDSLAQLQQDEKDENGKLVWAGLETTKDQIETFFKLYIEVFDKNFEIWRRNTFVFAAASQNEKVAHSFAKWFLGEVTDEMRADEENILANCTVHENCTLSMKDWIGFLDSCSTDRSDPILSRNLDALQEISRGSYLYAAYISDKMQTFLKDVKRYWFIQAHITQSTERGVQEMSICAANRKGEGDASVLVMIRSANLSKVFEKIRSDQKTKKKTANQHMSAGCNGERELRSKAAKRNNERRKSKGSQERDCVLPCTDTSKRHIRKAIDGHISAEDKAKLREVQVERRNRQNSNTCSKGLRHQQFIEKVTSKLNNPRRTRKADSLKARALTVPDVFHKVISISKFGKNATKEYLKKELLARGALPSEIEGEKILVTTLKLMLARLELVRRGWKKDDIEKINEWSTLKSRLLEDKMGLHINLLDETNKVQISHILELASSKKNS